MAALGHRSDDRLNDGSVAVDVRAPAERRGALVRALRSHAPSWHIVAANAAPTDGVRAILVVDVGSPGSERWQLAVREWFAPRARDDDRALPEALVVIATSSAAARLDFPPRPASARIDAQTAAATLGAACDAALAGLWTTDHFADADDVSLSAAEQTVADALVYGASNAQIAETLGVSVNTVKFHLAAIYDKLGVHNRTEAATRLRPRWL